MLRRAMMAGGGGGSSAAYDALMLSLGPLRWWKLEETAGVFVADSSGNVGDVNGAANSDIGPFITNPAAGFHGIGRGISTLALSLPAPDFQGSDSGQWTVLLWLVGAAGTNQYVLNRANNAAFIYNFVAERVELFRNIGGSGADPRPGSQIVLSNSDPSPSMIVYRYNDGQWSGFKDGAKVFDVARRFALGGGSQPWSAQGSGSSNPFLGKRYDIAMFSKALTDSEIAALYAAART